MYEDFVVVKTLVAIRVASNEKEVLQRMAAVFSREEWVEVPGLKAQDGSKVNREVKDGMSVSQISRFW